MDTSPKLNLVDFLPWWQQEFLNPVDQSILEGHVRGDPYISYTALAEKLVGHPGPIAQDIFRALVISQGGNDPGL